MVTRTTAEALLAARTAVKAMGPNAAHEVLVRASDPMPDTLSVTYWPDGVGATGTGTEDDPGCGLIWRGTFEDYVTWLEAYAPEVHAKKSGRMISHGRSRYGGSADLECVERSWIFADADDVGDPDAIEWALRAAGIAFVIQRRSADRFHLEIPLAGPRVPIDDVIEWKATRYMPEYGWLLGVLSEIGELSCRDREESISHLGFDAATDRLLQLRFASCRRTSADPIPTTIYGDGNALSWDRLATLTGYCHEMYAAMVRVHRAGADDETWLRALSHDGRVLKHLRAGKYAVTCPWAGGHSKGNPGSSTVLFADGTWHCSHGSCAGRGNADVFAQLSDDAQRIVIEGLESSARFNAGAPFAPYILEYAARAGVGDLSKMAIAVGRAGGDVAGWGRAVRRRRERSVAA